MLDFGVLPPEINSGRMYAGPGAGSMLAAAAAWNSLSAELQSAASFYESAISGLTGGPWLGPSATAMAAAVTPYIGWMNATAGQAELAATQAHAAAAAHAAAFAATVPPPVIAANRAQLMMLIATNFFGQNTAAIAATEAQYAEMWAQDATAMYGYAANSAAATASVTPFNPAPQTTNLAGVATQGAASANTVGTSAGTGAQSALSQLTTMVPTALQTLASPASAASTPVVNQFGTITDMSGFSLGAVLTSVVSMYAAIPGWTALSWSSTLMGSMLGPLMGSTSNLAFTPALASANQAAAAAAAEAAGAAGAAAAPSVLGAGFAGGFGGLAGLGGLAGMGQAASLGGLSVPSSWGWAASGSAALLGGEPMMLPLAVAAESNSGAGFGFPFMFPGGALARTASAGAAGAVASAASAKYLPRLRVVARSPAAGYSDEPAAPPIPDHPLPVGFPAYGYAPPGYRPAIVYLPTNGHAPANA